MAKRKKPTAKFARRKAPTRGRRLTTQRDALFGAVFVMPMPGVTLGAFGGCLTRENVNL